jgi:uncharacterized protein (TIGR01244 family)
MDFAWPSSQDAKLVFFSNSALVFVASRQGNRHIDVISACDYRPAQGSVSASRGHAYMDTITYITPRFAVTGALAPEDFPKVTALGFRSVVSNRPDGEEDGQLTGRDEAVLAWRSGLAFRHVPATRHELFTDRVVEGMADALNGLERPVLAHCKSGLRSVVLWAAASARSGSVECVLEALRRAGFDPDALRHELEAQANRKRWLGQAHALRCGEAQTMPPPARRAA